MLGCGNWTPALFANISSFPNVSMVFFTTALQKPFLEFSPAIVIHLLPYFSTYFLVFAASSCSYRYTIAISAPSFAKATTVALPIPLSPPVIIAIIPNYLSDTIIKLLFIICFLFFLFFFHKGEGAVSPHDISKYLYILFHPNIESKSYPITSNNNIFTL